MDLAFALVGLLLLGLALAYTALQVHALRRWRGGFRLAAALMLCGTRPRTTCSRSRS